MKQFVSNSGTTYSIYSDESVNPTNVISATNNWWVTEHNLTGPLQVAKYPTSSTGDYLISDATIPRCTSVIRTDVDTEYQVENSGVERVEIIFDHPEAINGKAYIAIRNTSVGDGDYVVDDYASTGCSLPQPTATATPIPSPTPTATPTLDPDIPLVDPGDFGDGLTFQSVFDDGVAKVGSLKIHAPERDEQIEAERNKSQGLIVDIMPLSLEQCVDTHCDPTSVQVISPTNATTRICKDKNGNVRNNITLYFFTVYTFPNRFNSIPVIRHINLSHIIPDSSIVQENDNCEWRPVLVGDLLGTVEESSLEHIAYEVRWAKSTGEAIFFQPTVEEALGVIADSGCLYDDWWYDTGIHYDNLSVDDPGNEKRIRACPID